VKQADYIVGMPAVVDVILELKGSDLKHAYSQVESTLDAWKTSEIRFPQIACLIVYGRIEGKKKRAGRVPRMDSIRATLELDFYRTNRALLWIRESGSEKFTFNEFLRKNDVH
jgi:hypothetical protein